MRTKTIALFTALAAANLINGCALWQSGKSNATMKTADGPLLHDGDGAYVFGNDSYNAGDPVSKRVTSS